MRGLERRITPAGTRNGVGRDRHQRARNGLTERRRSRTDLGEIAVPTLVITGAQDVAEISAVGELLVSGIAGARAAVIENADHVVPWRAPDELAGLILEFLA